LAYYKIKYRIGRESGIKIIEASDKVSALEKFRLLRLGVVLQISETSKPIGSVIKEFFTLEKNRISSNRVNQDAWIAVLRLIGILLDAGIPITTALREGIDTTENRQLNQILKSILRDLENGSSLYNACEKFSIQLGRLSISMIKLGEDTGTLSDSILKLADILDKIQANRRALIKATRYPLFIVVAMIIAFSIVIVMVIPEFQSVFEESKVELPFPTLMLLWVEGALKEYGVYIVSFSIILSIIYGYLYSKFFKIKLMTDRFILRIYVIGTVTHFALLGRFIYILDVLVGAGIPISKALDTANGVVENEWIKRNITKIKIAIEEGRTLTTGFRESGIFESVVIQMIKAGEDGGALNKMLGKISKYYTDRYQYIIDNIATMIEPILITAIAGFVLILALGIFLPMWGLVDTI